MKMMLRAAMLAAVLLGTQWLKAAPADTLRLTFNTADSLFLKKNFALLAAQYNLSEARAMKVQAKLYPNPNIYVEQSLVNKATRANYDTDPTRTGNTETILQVQQLILLAGKRNKQVRLADINAKLAEANFEDVLRTLRLQLHEDLAQLYYNNISLFYLKEERKSIDTLSGSLGQQLNKGFVSLNEIVRVKSLLLELDKNINDYVIDNSTVTAEINTLLGNDAQTIVKPQVDIQAGLRAPLLPVINYLDSATAYNPDLKSYNYLVDQAKAQYSLNKALAVPDASIQGVYDKSGNYIRNYYGIGLGFQLPAWNRNQGNIRASKFHIGEAENTLKQEQLTVASSLVAYYSIYQNNHAILDTYKEDYEKQLIQLMDNVLENYRKRLISLTEFINYYESYKESYLGLLEVKSRFFQNAEQMNFLIGKTIIKY